MPLAMFINPNNHALDGGRASSAMEKEAVAQIARMFGWETHLGHLCGGGTIANFEALWIGRELRPGKGGCLRPAHYTHSRLSAVLNIPFETIAVDGRGRMDLQSLEKALASGTVGTVVVTLGARPPVRSTRCLQCSRAGTSTTSESTSTPPMAVTSPSRRTSNPKSEPPTTGSARPIPSSSTRISTGSSPTAAAALLFRDPSVGRFYQHSSPYTYFSSDELHLGEISLECSRPGLRRSPSGQP